MALRFALEGHSGNQDVVRNLEKLGQERLGKDGVVEGVDMDVPREVLDLNGYETFVDERGQVQLKKRDGTGGGGGVRAKDVVLGRFDGV